MPKVASRTGFQKRLAPIACRNSSVLFCCHLPSGRIYIFIRAYIRVCVDYIHTQNSRSSSSIIIQCSRVYLRHIRERSAQTQKARGSFSPLSRGGAQIICFLPRLQYIYRQARHLKYFGEAHWPRAIGWVTRSCGAFACLGRSRGGIK